MIGHKYQITHLPKNKELNGEPIDKHFVTFLQAIQLLHQSKIWCGLLNRVANMATKRNYKKEYKEYHSKDKQKKNRAGRNTARRRALAAGKVKKGGSKDVHHKDGNPRNNKKSNLKVVSRKKNRGKLRVRSK